MRELQVGLGERSYPIRIGADLLRSSAEFERCVTARQVLLLSNTIVAPLYAAPLRAALGDRQVIEAIIPDGEQHKTLATASRVWDVLMANRLGRDAQVLALGGGVVGDLAGFVAACYQRGIGLVQLPTTLLADVDSSVGGKTAVNHPGGKNMIGAFHQPGAVLIDVAALDTLPERELRAGLAEIIKYGLICDLRFFEWLEQNMARLRQRDPEALVEAIYRSCAIKADFVSRDERETGDRALLNLGHTFGHAIEVATDYTGWLHGEAVGAGLGMAAHLSARLGLMDRAAVQRVDSMLQLAGLDTPTPRFGAAQALDYMRIDKKVKSGRIRLILLKGIGGAFMTGDYDDAALHATLKHYFEPSPMVAHA
jgi:3-dehydroquinate synthase